MALPSFTLVPQLTRHVKCLSDAITEIVLVVMEHSLGERQSALASSSLLHVCSSLQRLLPPDLVLVELGEVVDDDGDGKGDDEDATDTADEADTLAGKGLGVHVAVADGGHGDGGPPEGGWNACEMSITDFSLREVAEAGEDEDAHGHEHEEEPELLVAVTDGEAQTLEASRVPGELQDPQNSHDSEDLDHTLDVLVLALVHLVVHQEQRDVVGEDGEDVNDVEASLEEGPLVTGRKESEQVLESEPGYAHSFDYS